MALTAGLPWPWSWPLLLLGVLPVVGVGAVAVIVMVGRLTSRRDRRRFLTLTWRWLCGGRRG